MNYLIFGGSGFIGTHLIRLLKAECRGNADQIYDLDLVMPGKDGTAAGAVEKIDGVRYARVDVRQPITLDFQPTPEDVIFHLAAIHRTPGHREEEYFDTNIRGAEQVAAFAERYGIRRMLFTSSIACYGTLETQKSEDTLPMPNTPYGISKLVAEKILAGWAARDARRELTILRPGVVYGRGEHGNMTRLYQAIRGRYYAYAGRRDTVKACIYVKDLVRFFRFRMIDHRFPGVDIINCTLEPAPSIQRICEAMQQAAGLQKRWIPTVPAGLLRMGAAALAPLGGKKRGIHPERVKKLMVSTRVSGQKLADSGFGLRYSLRESFADWYEDCGRQGLY